MGWHEDFFQRKKRDIDVVYGCVQTISIYLQFAAIVILLYHRIYNEWEMLSWVYIHIVVVDIHLLRMYARIVNHPKLRLDGRT